MHRTSESSQQNAAGNDGALNSTSQPETSSNEKLDLDSHLELHDNSTFLIDEPRGSQYGDFKSSTSPDRTDSNNDVGDTNLAGIVQFKLSSTVLASSLGFLQNLEDGSSSLGSLQDLENASSASESASITSVKRSKKIRELLSQLPLAKKWLKSELYRKRIPETKPRSISDPSALTTSIKAKSANIQSRTITRLRGAIKRVMNQPLPRAPPIQERYRMYNIAQRLLDPSLQSPNHAAAKRRFIVAVPTGVPLLTIESKHANATTDFDLSLILRLAQCRLTDLIAGKQLLRWDNEVLSQISKASLLPPLKPEHSLDDLLRVENASFRAGIDFDKILKDILDDKEFKKCMLEDPYQHQQNHPHLFGLGQSSVFPDFLQVGKSVADDMLSENTDEDAVPNRSLQFEFFSLPLVKPVQLQKSHSNEIHPLHRENMESTDVEEFETIHHYTRPTRAFNSRKYLASNRLLQAMEETHPAHFRTQSLDNQVFRPSKSRTSFLTFQVACHEQDIIPEEGSQLDAVNHVLDQFSMNRGINQMVAVNKALDDTQAQSRFRMLPFQYNSHSSKSRTKGQKRQRFTSEPAAVRVGIFELDYLEEPIAKPAAHTRDLETEIADAMS